uniref:PTB domain-containing protein n=1 Tax=Macrostomum lignano TaxID=282301 RepID=A0A1I8FMH3_9PLAT
DIQIQLGESANQFGRGSVSPGRHSGSGSSGIAQLNSLPRPRQGKAGASASGLQPSGPPQAPPERAILTIRRSSLDHVTWLELRLQELASGKCAPRETGRSSDSKQPQRDQQALLAGRSLVKMIDKVTAANAGPGTAAAVAENYQEVEMIHPCSGDRAGSPRSRGTLFRPTEFAGKVRRRAANCSSLRLLRGTPRSRIHQREDRTSHGIAASVSEINSLRPDKSSTTPRAASSTAAPAANQNRLESRTVTRQFCFALGAARQLSHPRDSTSFPAHSLSGENRRRQAAKPTRCDTSCWSRRRGGGDFGAARRKPAFAGLAAFVEQHAVDRLALRAACGWPDLRDAGRHATKPTAWSGDRPRRRRVCAVDEQPATQQGGVGNSVYPVSFLGSVSVESLVGQRSRHQELSACCWVGDRPRLNSADCQLRVEPDALILSDQQRKPFFRKHFPLSAILHCGFDGLNRRLGNRSLYGLVVRTGGSS